MVLGVNLLTETIGAKIKLTCPLLVDHEHEPDSLPLPSENRVPGLSLCPFPPLGGGVVRITVGLCL